jgi:hypothetical protein
MAARRQFARLMTVKKNKNVGSPEGIEPTCGDLLSCGCSFTH